MKKRFFYLVMVLCLALGLSVSLAGCGSTEDKIEATGEEYSWGNITLTVPDGFDPSNGITGEDDEDGLFLYNSGDDFFPYFQVAVEDSEAHAKSGLALTKEMNEDVEDQDITIGDRTWTGVFYRSSDIEEDTPVWQGYTEVDGVFYSVMCAGCEIDDDNLLLVLSTVNKAEK